MIRRPPRSPLFPSPPLSLPRPQPPHRGRRIATLHIPVAVVAQAQGAAPGDSEGAPCACATTDRKSTRLNSSHQIISYAVFCLKKKKNNKCENSGANKNTEPV